MWSKTGVCFRDIKCKYHHFDMRLTKFVIRVEWDIGNGNLISESPVLLFFVDAKKMSKEEDEEVLKNSINREGKSH